MRRQEQANRNPKDMGWRGASHAGRARATAAQARKLAGLRLNRRGL